MSDAPNGPTNRNPQSHRLRWILIAVAAVLVAVVLLHLLDSKQPTRAAQGQAVKVARAARGDMPETLSELGTVTPIATVTVLPQLSGYLTEVGFKEGQDVAKGQFLAQIDPRQYQIDLQQAEATLLKDQATLDQARSDLARYHQLQAQKAIAEQTVIDAEFAVKQGEAQVKSDQAGIAQFKLDLAYCRITAPVAGRAGLRLVDPGNYVTASSSNGIVVLTTMKPTTVEFTIAQNDLNQVVARVNSGAKLPVTAYSSDNSSTIATGTLYAISNQMATSTGTVTLRASFANEDEALFPNEFVNIKILVDTLHQAVLVPTPAVLSGAPGDYVYLVKSNNTVAVRKVALGPSDGVNTAILSGLTVGDTVVIDGTDRLTDGAKITVPANRSPMNISRLFVLRPVATSLLMIAMVLIGVVAVRFLPVSSLPDVDYPTIQVQTFYPGASPQVMATTVTAPLEVQLGQIPSLTQMTSASSAGASIITLQFNLALNLDVAEQNVQEAINAANSLLPSGLPAPPIYAKVNPADQPILTLAVTSESLSLTQLQDIANNRLASKISEVPGVGLVTPSGGNVPAVRVEADPQKLAGYGLNIDDLRTLLANINVSQPKGNFDGPDLDYTINDNDQIQDPKDYLNTVIAYQNGAAVFLRDVARVTQSAQDIEQGAWYDRTPAIVLNVMRQPGANVIATVNQIKKQLPQLLASLPQSMHVQIVADSTGVIRASVSDAAVELLLSIALVVLVIFVFLRNLPATIIPSISVPVSLIATLAVMYELNYSIDNLSLMALIVATGFVVDDSIVMIENIVRYLEAGSSPLDAALEGAGQIGFTIMSLTISLIAVLIPLLFMGGVIGRLFSEFAVTLAVTIVMSAVVALTLVPMLCARILKRKAERSPSGFERLSEGLFDRTLAAYERGLRWVLRHQALTLGVALVTLILTAVLYIVIPKGLFPVQDVGVIQAISVADNSVSYKAMAQRQAALSDAILKDPDVASLTSYVGVDGTNTTLNNGRFLIVLKAENGRSLSARQIARRLQNETASVSGIKLFPQPEQNLTLATVISPNQYQFVLRGPSEESLAKYVPELIGRIKQIKSISDVTSDLSNEGLSVNVEVNRQLAARFGITPATIDNALYDALGQRIVSTIFNQSNQYRVVLVAKPESLPNLHSLGNLYLPTQTGTTGQVPLSAIADIKITKSPLVISHLAQFPAVTVSFNLAADASLSSAVEEIERAEKSVQLPPSITTAFQGAAQAFQDSLSSEVFLLAAALITVYLVLGVLYESYIHPVTILSTLPSAGIGALLALMLTGNDLDVIGIIGIVLLIGIVKKNGIMIVDFALEAERQHGKPPEQAIFEASLLRFRPILMTTLAAMLGALPLLLGTGTGSELRRPLGVAIFGGLLVSQILTLFTTPVIYLSFEQMSRRLRRKPAEPAAESAV